MNTVNIPYIKKLQTIAYNYLKICTNQPPKTNKKLNKHYWRVYNFLYTTDSIQPKIQSLYEYALELENKHTNDTKQLMSLSEFIQNAEKWRIHLIKRTEKTKINTFEENANIPTYKDFSLSDLENL